MLNSYTIVDFHLFYDGAVDIPIWALLKRSPGKVSDTQMDDCGLLFVLLENFSIIWRQIHCRWRAAKCDLRAVENVFYTPVIPTDKCVRLTCPNYM